MTTSTPQVGIIMGSDSDLKIMSEAAKVLDEFKIAYEVRVISAHRTPDIMTSYAAEAKKRGLKVIIAGAGGSAHLPGMTASESLLPVLAVPIKSNPNDHEALWSNIKMPGGIPLATMPENGAKNAALLAIEILSLSDSELALRYEQNRKAMWQQVRKTDGELSKVGWKAYLKNK